MVCPGSMLDSSYVIRSNSSLYSAFCTLTFTAARVIKERKRMQNDWVNRTSGRISKTYEVQAAA